MQCDYRISLINAATLRGLTLAIWTPPVVQEELRKWSTVVGLHVYIRLVCEQPCSSPDGNTHAPFPCRLQSQCVPRALSGFRCVGLTSCPSRHASLQPVVSPQTVWVSHPSRLKSPYATTRYSWPPASKTQRMRACFAAKATAAILSPRRWRTASTHTLLASVRWAVNWRTERAP